ncbi:TRAP transporter small permease [Sneathiella limimaris]|uniref:TRAP transporter small permease n=1 Tax=Sneathiella limimaris TaxID=1964213 RepID=UPI00146EF547|nr:TRAP transporter small permease [Sneathiella limimaris]
MPDVHRPDLRPQIALRAIQTSRFFNKYVERSVVFLLGVLVLDVWLGILARYVLPVDWTFTEELARYLMIWMALIAVSCAIAHREHIGVLILFERFPPEGRKWLAVAFDVIAFCFFAVIFYYGIGMVDRGFNRYTMINEIPKAYPFIGVPVAAALCCLQLALVAVHDFFSPDAHVAAERAEV